MDTNNTLFRDKNSLQQFIRDFREEISSLYRVFNNPKRLEILASASSEPANFRELLEKTKLQASNLSNHLLVLIENNLLEKLERGLYLTTNRGVELLETIAQSFLKIKLKEELMSIEKDSLVSKYLIRCVIKDTEVRNETLEPVYVASIHVVGEDPENDGWRKLMEWAKQKGITDFEIHPIFGFNHRVADKHGYEFWIKVDPDTKREGEFVIKEFKEGLYTIKRCNGVSNISKAWKDLVVWRRRSEYLRDHSIPCLEKYISYDIEAGEETLVLNLYLPIKKKD